jgi:hypothetical protein
VDADIRCVQGWPQAHGCGWRGACFFFFWLSRCVPTYGLSGLGSSARDPISPRCACRRLERATDLLEPVAVQVYDVAGWVQRHPGGKVLLTYVGEDATDSVRAFHRDEEQMRKYLSPLHVATLKEEKSGQVLASRPDCWKVHHTTSNAPHVPCQGSGVHEVLATRNAALERDFRNLRKKLEDAGLFKAKPWFYVAMLAHVIALELAGWAVLKNFGSGWLPYCFAVCLLVTAQVG